MTRVDPVTDPVFQHAEGPVWFDEFRGLRWVDMLAGEVAGLRDDGSVDRRRVGSVAAALRPRRGGGAALLLEHDLATTDGDPLDETSPVAAVLRVSVAEGVRLNEGGCDSQGRFLLGSMAWDSSPAHGRVVRVTPGDGRPTVETLRESTDISNGIDFDPTGSLCYFVDSPSRRIEVIDYAAGPFAPTRTIDLSAHEGIPDGLCVAADGSIWVAMYGGGCVLGFSPDGRLRERLSLPVSNVTACAFGGSDRATLYVTTSALEVSRDDEPLAGAVFAATPGAVGMPVLPYAG